jgi:hypothetical protein
MNTNSSNRWFRQNLTKIAAALIEPARIPAAAAEVAQLKQV